MVVVVVVVVKGGGGGGGMGGLRDVNNCLWYVLIV